MEGKGEGRSANLKAALAFLQARDPLTKTPRVNMSMS